MELTQTQMAMAKILVECALNKKDISYQDLGKKTGVFWRQVGRQVGAVSVRCLELGLPAISVLVVNKNTGIPGPGFIPLLRERGYILQTDNQNDVIRRERDKVFACKEWADLIGEVSSLNAYLDEIDDNHYKEGAKKSITVNYYERDPRARRECIEHNTPQYTCYICGFNSAQVYGDNFANLIHVHHKVPLSQISNEGTVNPVEDMVPVCPNCHMILHSKGKGEVYDVEYIKSLYKNKNR